MKKIQKRSDLIYVDHQQRIYRQTDRMFAVLMVIQWVAGVVAALVISPRTWIGQTSEINIHVWAAVILGGVLSIFPIGMALLLPGHVATRYTIAVGQMLMSSLLIHLSGGRIETHFHVFGSLAFLSFYRDWRVLAPATVVVALDHMLRGIYYPQSVFGVLAPENWRWVEHAGWVIFEDIFLVISCIRSQKEMRQIADHTAELDLSEARYRSVTDSASEAIIGFDAQGTILFANRSAENMFGYSAEELLGKNVVQLAPQKMRRRQTAAMKRLINLTAVSSTQVFEAKACHRTGEEFLTETSVSVYGTDEGKVLTAVVRDITERRRAEEALKRSEEYLNLFRLANDAILILEPETEIIRDVNQKACEIYELMREEFVGRSIKDFTKDVGQGERFIAELSTTGSCQSYESVHVRPDGREMVFLINASVIEHEGRPAILSINRDITERNLIKRDLENNLSLLGSTFEATADGIIAVDLENQITSSNQKFVDMFGIHTPVTELAAASREISFHLISLMKEPEDLMRLMKRSLDDPDEITVSTLELKDGRTIERYTQPQKLDGATIGRVMSFRDITERKRAEEQLIHDALHDGLTGLANRTLFMDHLRMTIERGKGKHTNPFAVFYLDFDRFKVINDSLGHAEGDKLLKYIALRLQGCTRAGDLVARLGGDEFVMLVTELEDPSEATQVVKRIENSLKQPFDLDGREIFVTTSIGLALSSSGHTSADDMLRDADIAMYCAKANGRARHEIFDAEMHKRASKKLQIETEMRAALGQGEFCLYYQPIVRLDTHELVGFESLIRWLHPTRGLVGPDDFIPVAEENGMIIKLGQWTVRESCRQMQEWHETLPSARDLSVSINLSCKEFIQADLVELIGEAIMSSGLEPQFVKLEITESHVLENSDQAIDTLSRLRALGVQISLDDFGTGYSSLSYLHRLPINFLKIDRSFVSRMTSSEENREIVSTIVRLGQNLRMSVIAEGIETEEQVDCLHDLKCELGQGYYFAKPLPADAAREFITEFSLRRRLPPLSAITETAAEYTN